MASDFVLRSRGLNRVLVFYGTMCSTSPKFAIQYGTLIVSYFVRRTSLRTLASACFCHRPCIRLLSFSCFVQSHYRSRRSYQAVLSGHHQRELISGVDREKNPASCCFGPLWLWLRRHYRSSRQNKVSSTERAVDWTKKRLGSSSFLHEVVFIDVIVHRRPKTKTFFPPLLLTPKINSWSSYSNACLVSLQRMVLFSGELSQSLLYRLCIIMIYRDNSHISVFPLSCELDVLSPYSIPMTSLPSSKC